MGQFLCLRKLYVLRQIDFREALIAPAAIGREFDGPLQRPLGRTEFARLGVEYAEVRVELGVVRLELDGPLPQLSGFLKLSVTAVELGGDRLGRRHAATHGRQVDQLALLTLATSQVQVG